MKFFKDVSLCKNAVEPDIFRLHPNTGERPSGQLVVSRSSDGKVLSLYQDNIWDFTPYATTVRPSPIFIFTGIHERHRDNVKWIIFCLDRICESVLGEYSISTLKNYLGLLGRVSRHCIDQKIELIGWMSNSRQVLDFLDNHATLSDSRRLSALFVALAPKARESGIEICASKAVKSRFAEIQNLSKQCRRQHPVIPSRILFEMLKYSDKELRAFNLVGEDFESYYATIPVRDTYSTHGSGWFKNFLSRYSTSKQSSTLADHLYSRDVVDKASLNRYVAHLDYCAKILILAYSGMRDLEVVSLNYDCLQVKERSSGNFLRLIGYSTKLVGARKDALWVTSEHVLPAIEYLQTLARVCRDNLIKRGCEGTAKTDISEQPLFNKFTFTTRRHDFKHRNSYRKTSFRRSDFYSRVPELSLNRFVISEDDFKELTLLEPFRDWASDGFGIGDLWHITNHQFRRSLAIYSAQSGLISLPALKAQFKHISADMTLYYRNNAIEARKIFNVGAKHFANEYKHAKPEADFYAFLSGTLMNDQTIKGSMGKNYEKLKPKSSRGVQEIYQSKDKTIERFRKGELSWKETALGGCMSAAPCTKKIMGPLTVCLQCEDAVIMEGKLANTIQLQEKLMSTLDKDSPEYRFELAELKQLNTMKSSFDR